MNLTKDKVLLAMQLVAGNNEHQLSQGNLHMIYSKELHITFISLFKLDGHHYHDSCEVLQKTQSTFQ